MNSDTDATEFNQLLPGDDESPDQRRERRARLERLCTRSPERCTVLVWDLTQQIAVMKAQCATKEAVVRELQEIQQEQSRLINKLTAPPWHSALFVRRAETSSGLLAEVLHNGSRRLVQMGEEIDIEALVEGQVVYLGHELNAILGVAPTELHGVGEIAAVERVLDGDWLVLRDRDLRMQVRQSRRLIHTDLAPGDSVRWNREAMLALERIESSSSDDLFCTETLTAHSTEKLGGVGPEVEQVIALFTQCIAQPEMAARYGLTRGNTLLMHGPPGNGKTSIARIVGSALAAAVLLT